MANLGGSYLEWATTNLIATIAPVSDCVSVPSVKNWVCKEAGRA